MLRNPAVQKGLVAAGMIFVMIWLSVAFGSYAYLYKLELTDEFEFPWNQFIVAAPYIVTEGWHGLETLDYWMAAIWGLGATLTLPTLLFIFGWRYFFGTLFGWYPAQPVYGASRFGWPSRRAMNEDRIVDKRRPF